MEKFTKGLSARRLVDRRETREMILKSNKRLVEKIGGKRLDSFQIEIQERWKPHTVLLLIYRQPSVTKELEKKMSDILKSFWWHLDDAFELDEVAADESDKSW